MCAEVLFPDYWLVSTSSASYRVSAVMARYVENALDRWPRPRWIRFVDVAGSVVRLRTASIESVLQTSTETRAMWRRFEAERDREESEEWDH